MGYGFKITCSASLTSRDYALLSAKNLHWKAFNYAAIPLGRRWGDGEDDFYLLEYDWINFYFSVLGCMPDSNNQGIGQNSLGTLAEFCEIFIFNASPPFFFSKKILAPLSTDIFVHSDASIKAPARKTTSGGKSIAEAFKESKFYVSFLLIATFFFFIVTADLIYLFAVYLGE